MVDETRPAAIASEAPSSLGEDQQRDQHDVAASSVPTAGRGASSHQPGEGDSLAALADDALPDTAVERGRESRRVWREAVTRFLDTWWGGAAQARALDYGGEVADALHFARTCRSASTFDPSGQISESAVHRFAQQGANVTTLTSTDGYGASFDAVTAFDALQDAPGPAARVDELIWLTRAGGMLFLATSDAGQDAGQLERLDALLEARGCRPVGLLADRVRAYVKGPALTVAVPIYNAYDHVCRLIESIRSTAPGYTIRWLFVNDASPDPRISGLLQSFAEGFEGSNQSCQVIDRTENRGFPLTANEAMEAAGTDDVILLNSDTIVYDAWARKLVQAAYSDPRIGTVTPLSNNASAFSVFRRVTIANNVNSTLGLANLPVIDIPVGVGFCLYVKREALDRVGALDSVFGRGYGEETDFCLRAAAAGYRNVLAPTVFIYHAGSASMLEAQIVRQGESTVQEHENLIASRYPQFPHDVYAFVSSKVMDRLEWDLANRYVTEESSRRPSIGVVVHDDVFSPVIGGTTDHLRDMVRELGSAFVFYFITPPAYGATKDRIKVTAYVDGIGKTVTPHNADFGALFAELSPSLIHVHHLMHFSAEFIVALTAWSGPKFFTIHDYFGVCEQLTLLNYKREFCNIPDQEECGKCAHALWGTGYAAVSARRETYQQLIDSCALVIAPSATALDLFRRAITIPDAKARVAPHPAVMQKYRDAIDDPFRHATLVPQVADVAAEVGRDQSAADATQRDPKRAKQQTDARLPGAAGPAESGQAQYEGVTTAQAVSAERGVNTALSAELQRKLRDAQLRVGFIGYNAPQKGIALIQGIIAACSRDPIVFVSIGEIGNAAKGHAHVISTGRYNRLDVVDLIKANKVDVIVIGSVWPETYCFTVSEAWMADVPVITGPIGAQAERVRATGAGLSLPDFNVATFTQTLRRLTTDRAQLDALKLAAAQVTPTTDYAAYRDEYSHAAGGRWTGTRLFTSVRREIPASSQSTANIPLVDRLVRIRKRMFPVGSIREKLYFGLHNVVTRSYAGNLRR